VKSGDHERNFVPRVFKAMETLKIKASAATATNQNVELILRRDLLCCHPGSDPASETRSIGFNMS